MRIVIISDQHFPSGSADSEVTVNTAAALGSSGAAVTLLIPYTKKSTVEGILSYYGVPPSFELNIVPGWPLPDRQIRIEKLFHGLLAPMLRSGRRAQVIHSRNLLPLLCTRLLKARWSFETYRRYAAETPWLPRLLSRFDLSRGIGAVAHSDASRDDLLRLGLPAEAVIVARPGASLENYTPILEPAEARRHLGLDLRGPVVGYVGNVQLFKGMDFLIDVAARMPEVRFLVVGGTQAEVAILEREAARKDVGNLVLPGHRPAGEVATWLFASDLLLLPATHSNVAPSFIGRTLFKPRLPGTPFKIYSYFAAARAIVAADQMINRELLRDGQTAALFGADDVEACAATIGALIADPGRRKILARQGRQAAEKFAWSQRARTMLRFFERRLSTLG